MQNRASHHVGGRITNVCLLSTMGRGRVHAYTPVTCMAVWDVPSREIEMLMRYSVLVRCLCQYPCSTGAVLQQKAKTGIHMDKPFRPPLETR